MTDVRETNSIRNRIYLAGEIFQRDPVPVQFTVRRYDVKIKTSNLGLRVDRPFVFEGFPNVALTHEIVFSYPDIREPALLERLGLLASMGQPFDVAIWKQTRDVFDGDGSRKDFYLQARTAAAANLSVGVPAVNLPEYETRVEVYSASLGSIPVPTATALTVVHKTNATIDTGSPASGEAWIEDDGHMIGNRWVTRIRLNAAPADASDVLVVTYIPLFKMVIDQESPRSYAESLREPRGQKMVQFG